MSPDGALALCRFLHDGAGLALWGVFIFLCTLVPRSLGEDLGQRFEAFRLAAVTVAVVTLVAALPIEAAVIGDGWRDAVSPGTVQSVLLETSVGSAWIAQAVAASLLAATVPLPSTVRPSATALASGLLLATLALTGHAAMHEGSLGIAHRLNDAVHVLAGGAWLGALVVLVPLLSVMNDQARGREAGIALRRFSAGGHVAVAVVVVSGVFNTVLVLGRWPSDWSSPYQAMLAMKIALVFVMATLAVANRYILIPRMVGLRTDTLLALRRATMIEIALGASVVALVSIFGLLEPA